MSVHVSMMDETQATDEVSTTWLNFIINTCTKRSLVDLYSRNGKFTVRFVLIEILFDIGEPAQIAKDMTLDCITVHASDTISSRIKDLLK